MTYTIDPIAGKRDVLINGKERATTRGLSVVAFLDNFFVWVNPAVALTT